MANICYNRLIFKSKEDADKAVELLTGLDDEGIEREVTFNVLVPMPANIYKGNFSWEMEKDPNSWYAWSIANWGTKWDASEGRRVSAKVISFETPWSYPERWLWAFARACLKHGIERVEHEFVIEGGMGNGRALIIDGMVGPYRDSPNAERRWREESDW